MFDAGMSFTDFDFEEDKLRELVKKGSNALDGHLKVVFYKHAEQDAFQSREQGRKIFQEFVYVRILMPANRLSEIERRATEEDKARFPRQYAAFLANADQLSVGTPLKELPTITPVQVMELNALKVDTIEQLANMPDYTAQVLGTGGLELKKRARVFLDRTTNAEAQGEQIRELQRQLAQLMAEREQLVEKPPEIKVTAGGKEPPPEPEPGVQAAPTTKK